MSAGNGPPSQAATSPLAGLRVVEFSQLIAAPFCGLTLLDLGAEVIKVESPVGDAMRNFPPLLENGQSAQFAALNRGKRSVVAELGTAEGRALATRLVHSADVILENLGNARTLLGVTYSEAAARRPELVWCAITGWGAGRPGRAIDPSLQAALGMISITGEEAGGPVRIPVPLVDFMTGMYAVQSILAALWSVRAGAPGAFLDCAMADATTTLVGTSALMAAGGYFSPRRLGSESPLVAPSGAYRTLDGALVQIVCVTERHWRGLCAGVGHPDWADDPACADNATRLINRDLVRARLEAVIATRTAEEWVTCISEHGALCERVRDIEEAWDDERLRARGLVAELDGDSPGVPRLPLLSLAGPATGARREVAPAPELGADTEAVRHELEGG